MTFCQKLLRFVYSLSVMCSRFVVVLSAWLKYDFVYSDDFMLSVDDAASDSPASFRVAASSAPLLIISLLNVFRMQMIWFDTESRTRVTLCILFMTGKIKCTTQLYQTRSRQIAKKPVFSNNFRLNWRCHRNGKTLFMLGCCETAVILRRMGTPKAVNQRWVISCWSWKVAWRAPTCSM